MVEKIVMVEKKELNEQTYQSNKKKLNKIALGIFIAGVVVGLGLIIVPRLISAQTTSTTPKALTSSEVETQTAAIRAEYTKKMTDDGWFEDQKAMQQRISDLNSSSMVLNDFESAKSSMLDDSVVITMTIFGVFIMVGGAIAAGVLLYVANLRKVAGYAAQGVMPVAKEVITEIAPTMGAATGVAASAAAPGIGDVAREIKKGMNEADKK